MDSPLTFLTQSPINRTVVFTALFSSVKYIHLIGVLITVALVSFRRRLDFVV